nr:hypothetical protein [Tanacetum cinerariifolium]
MVHTTRECTYSNFLKCQALNYKGTKGAVGLAQWFERMETVLHVNKCTVECQVKFASCTLLGGALTWWNTHVMTVGHDVAYEIPWNTLMKMMTENYCPRREKKKLETELWNLVVKDKVERYNSGLPDSIQGSVMESKPKKFQEAIKLARSLMLRRNQIGGNIPEWLGTQLSSLRILNLRFNNFDGNIPHELYNLTHTQILDLAHNNLSRNIPTCVNNFNVLSRIESISDV